MIDQLADIAEVNRMIDRVTEDLLQHAETGPLHPDQHTALMERLGRLFSVARTLQPSGVAR